MILGTTNYGATSTDSHVGNSPVAFSGVVNGLQTRLSAGIGSSDTTITVTSNAGFPTAGAIAVGTGRYRTEIVHYTGLSGSTQFTGCTRGAQGTTARSHPLGAKVASVITAEHINGHSAAIAAIEAALGSSNGVRRNLLLNPCGLVKQRSSLPTTDDAYAMDEWNLLLGAANASTIAREFTDVPTDGAKCAIKLTVGSANNNKFGVVQFIPSADANTLRGKLVSLQAKIKSSATLSDVRMALLEWTGTADSLTSDVVSSWNAQGTVPTLAANWAYLNTPANLSPTTAWGAAAQIPGLTVGASANNLAVFIWCEDLVTTQTTDYFLVTDVQLQLGAVCTAFVRRSYAEELHACQYQLQIVSSEEVGFALSTGNLYAPNFRFQREMRASPTLSGASFTASTGSNGTAAMSPLTARRGYLYNSAANWTGGALITFSGTISCEL